MLLLLHRKEISSKRIALRIDKSTNGLINKAAITTMTPKYLSQTLFKRQLGVSEGDCLFPSLDIFGQTGRQILSKEKHHKHWHFGLILSVDWIINAQYNCSSIFFLNKICLNQVSHLIFVFHWHMKGLKPDISKGNQRVSIIFRVWSSQDTLKLLLPWAPFLLSQMEVTHQRPSVRVVLVERYQSTHSSSTGYLPY